MIRLDCHKCGINFELTEHCIEKELVEMSAISKMAAAIVGFKNDGKCYRYYVVCPTCSNRIGKFKGSMLFD